MVLDLAVRLHHVRANLAAEGDIHLGFIEPVRLRLALLNFEVVEARAKHLHSKLAIFVLAALDLAPDDDIGGKVRDADGGLNFVDVLTAFATGAERVDAQIFRADIDFDLIVDFGNDEHRCEGSVAARGLVKRRNTYQSMHAGFADEHAVGVFTCELDGSVLYPGFFTRSFVEHDGAHALALSPAQIHAQQDGSPILRLGATGTRLDGHDGVEVIAFAGEQRFRFQVADVNFRIVELAIQLLEQVVALLGVALFLYEMNVGVEITGERSELFVGRDLIFGALAVAQDGLRGFLIVPEIGRGDARFEGLQALTVGRGVKDNSEPS
jgi:hypothetical protein